jgi:hypothetical protein
MLHRQQVEAGRYAGAAHVHHLLGRAIADHGAKRLPQFSGRLEAPVCLQVVGERAIRSPRHMAADAVDRFHLAAIARRGAGVAQQIGGRHMADGGVIEQHLATVVVQLDRRRATPRLRLRQRQAGRLPRGEAAVEHGRFAHAAQPQQPPQARRGQ